MKYNMLNMIKSLEYNGEKVDHRGIHVPRKGHVFIIADYAQIEPRCLNWIVGNKKFLEACRTMSPYEAAALSEGLWSADRGKLKDNDKRLYDLSKAKTIALGYGAGHEKFVDMVAGYGLDPYDTIGSNADDSLLCEYLGYLERLDEISKSRMWTGKVKGKTPEEIGLLANSWRIVDAWRRVNPAIVNLWNALDGAARAAASEKRDAFVVKLPSERSLKYYEPRMKAKKRGNQVESSVSVRLKAPLEGRKDNAPVMYYGGKFSENLTQAFARDVLRDACVRIWNELRFVIPFTVYDELVVEVPEQEAGHAKKEIERIMVDTPEWCLGLPLAVDIHIAEKYTK